MEQISVLGCGWLGFPLAIFLKEKGYRIKGSTKDPQKLSTLRKKEIEPFLLNFAPYDRKNIEKAKDFFNSSILIINIPPPKISNSVNFHLLQIKAITEAAKEGKVEKILFISSTSVYPNTGGVVTEKDVPKPKTSSGKALRKAEDFLINNTPFKTTILRLSGLIGYDRTPYHILKRKKKTSRIRNVPINVVHRDDCIRIIHEIIKKEVWQEIFNVSCDNHPLRKDFYEAYLLGKNIELPKFETGHTHYKIVDNEKLKRVLQYAFKYPDPCNI